MVMNGNGELELGTEFGPFGKWETDDTLDFFNFLWFNE